MKIALQKSMLHKYLNQSNHNLFLGLVLQLKQSIKINLIIKYVFYYKKIIKIVSYNLGYK